MIKRTYRANDVVKSEFLRLPLSLLANPKYKQMSLEAKFIYALLLNRMTLSQRNDWINENNEVYLIYTREEAANTLNISYKKSIAAFKELIKNGLLFEQRQGLGAPNLLYVLKAELTDEDAVEFADDFNGKDGDADEKTAEIPVNTQICQNSISRPAETAHHDMPNLHIRNCKNDLSRTSDAEHQDMPKPHASNTDNIKTENSYIENSQSVSRPDDANLQQILDRLELHIFSPNIQAMFVQAIERLYYTEQLKIGAANLPQSSIHSYLQLLDSDVLMSVLRSMKEKKGRIVNPMAYLMSTIINTICEKESNLILRLPPQYVEEDSFYSAINDSYEKGDEQDGYLYESGSTGDFRPLESIRSDP